MPYQLAFSSPTPATFFIWVMFFGFFFAISCKVALENGKERQEVLLDDPTLGLYISNDTWREMYDFSEGAVLLVLASEHYDEADYIRDYTKFLEMVQRKGEAQGL